jgi:hypothetical protein
VGYSLLHFLSTDRLQTAADSDRSEGVQAMSERMSALQTDSSGLSEVQREELLAAWRGLTDVPTCGGPHNAGLGATNCSVGMPAAPVRVMLAPCEYCRQFTDGTGQLLTGLISVFRSAQGSVCFEQSGGLNQQNFVDCV